MLIGRRVFARHARWALFVVLATVAAIGWYAWEAKRSITWPGGGSVVGLSLGIAAGVIIVFEFLIWPRKWLRHWRWFGSARSWLRAHIWLGLLSVPLVLLHAGVDFGGPLTSALGFLFVAVIVSGIYGLVLQQTLPRELLDDVPAETVFAQIDNVAKRDLWEAEDLVTALCGPPPGGSTVERDEEAAYWERRRKFREPAVVRQADAAVEAPLLRDAFYKDIAGYLEHGSRGNSRLNSLSNQNSLFADLRAKVEPAAIEAVDKLEQLCDQRRQFDRQERLHVGLHLWLWLHLPLSAALVVLLAWHAFTALYYL